jgi:hypothetical protein
MSCGRSIACRVPMRVRGHSDDEVTGVFGRLPRHCFNSRRVTVSRDWVNRVSESVAHAAPASWPRLQVGHDLVVDVDDEDPQNGPVLDADRRGRE